MEDTQRALELLDYMAIARANSVGRYYASLKSFGLENDTSEHPTQPYNPNLQSGYFDPRTGGFSVYPSPAFE